MTFRERADAFWEWFAETAPTIAAEIEDEECQNELLLRLQKVSEGLWFEVSTDDLPHELVISADGVVDLFNLVKDLVGLAPEIPGWEITALMPPMGFDVVTVYEGESVRAADLWFLPLASSKHPNLLGISIGIPGLAKLDPIKAKNAVLIILDTGLGEESAAMDINHIDYVELPEDPEAAGFMQIAALPGYIEWFKEQHPPSEEDVLDM